jgi:FemAB-related protein (PEP-CTERM system-associated)
MHAPDPALPAVSAGAPISVSRGATAAEWNAFIAQAQNGSFYHRFEWGAINEEELGHEFVPLVARAADQIAGVLPLVFVRSRIFGRILCSMPFVNYGGPCSSSNEACEALTREAMKLTRELGADYLELRCTQQLPVDIPVSLRKVSMTIDLAADPDVLWNAFTSKHRKNVKRAYKDDLAVKVGGAELLSTFYDILEESWHSLGTPLYRRAYFERIVATFPENTRLFICHQKDKPLAAAFCGYQNNIVEGLWAGGNAQSRRLDANYVLYWEMIRDSCQRGFRRFHLGRSTADSGGEVFKTKWNASAAQLYWHFFRADGGAMPELNVSNPKYQLATRAWRKLPRGVTRVLGPPLARSIP